MKIRNTAEIVKEILEQKPRARDCDFVLYGFVLNKYGYSVSIPFNELANLVKAEEPPSMETVGRARRKVMELYPSLRGDRTLATLFMITEFAIVICEVICYGIAIQ